MTRKRTLADMITDVADRADIEVPSAGTFVTKTTCTRWLNQSARRLFAKLVAAYGEDYYSSTTTIAVVANTASYALPSDFYQLDYFRVTLGGFVWVIPRATKDFIDNDPIINVGWALPTRPQYRLIGNNVIFTPTPKAAATVTMRYIGIKFMFDASNVATADLSADGDYIDGVNGWEEWIVLDVACKALTRSERDQSALRAEQLSIEADITAQAPERTRDAARIRMDYDGGW